MNPLTQSKNITILPVLIAFVLACFALSPRAQAVDPPPDGGYPGDNTAEGHNALFSLATGSANTAVGFDALYNNTTGFDNTATGYLALFSNTTGIDNTANGLNALQRNTTGNSNTATGLQALYSNTTGFNNTANGVGTLFSNTTGNDNTASGDSALAGNTTGANNIALGFGAGAALLNGNNNIEIGNGGTVSDCNTIRIGTQGTQTKTFVAGITGTLVAGGMAVGVDANGQLGVRASSARFKDAIKSMDKASEAILALQPVTFRYKQEIDPSGIPQFGLVAEEVEKVSSDLVARDDQGKPYTVRYEAVNAMLLNEFLKEHKKVEDLEGIVTSLAATVKEQAAQIQKVSAELEVNKPAPQKVLSNQ